MVTLQPVEFQPLKHLEDNTTLPCPKTEVKVVHIPKSE